MRYPGIIPAVTTPFDSSGGVDLGALEANVRALIDAGVQGVVATGTMGEASSLSLEERASVVEAIVAAADGHVPVIVGVSATNAETAGRYAAQAAAAGAAGVMLLPPLNYPGDAREMVAFYGQVAREGELPIMAYNNPAASGVDLSAQTLAQIAREVPALVAVKECSGDTRRIPALLAGTELEVLVGGDDWALEGFAGGATGWVSGVANVAPRDCVSLWERLQEGDLPQAQEIYQRILPLARLDMTPKLVQFFKAAMDAVGFVGGPCRPPRMALTEEDRQILDSALATLRGAPASLAARSTVA